MITVTFVEVVVFFSQFCLDIRLNTFTDSFCFFWGGGYRGLPNCLRFYMVI